MAIPGHMYRAAGVVGVLGTSTSRRRMCRWPALSTYIADGGRGCGKGGWSCTFLDVGGAACAFAHGGEVLLPRAEHYGMGCWFCGHGVLFHRPGWGVQVWGLTSLSGGRGKR